MTDRIDVVIPDEAIEAATRFIFKYVPREEVSAALAAAAPAIVAANQPTPNEDLRAALTEAATAGLDGWASPPDRGRRINGHAVGEIAATLVPKLMPVVEAFVAARTATALKDRADEIERELICCYPPSPSCVPSRHAICYYAGLARRLVLREADRG